MLYHEFITEPLIQDSYFNILQIESVKGQIAFHKKWLESSDQSFTLVDKGKLVKPDKEIEWIYSPWQIDFEDKNLINAILKAISQDNLANKEVDLNIKLGEIEDILEDILSDEPILELKDKEIGLTELLKLFGIEIRMPESSSLVDFVAEYMLIKRKFLQKKVFILEDVLRFLTQDDLDDLIHFSRLEEIYVLLVTDYIPSHLTITSGRYMVIDDDLCEIIMSKR